jgi:hypothetical protein
MASSSDALEKKSASDTGRRSRPFFALLDVSDGDTIDPWPRSLGALMIS